jgi:hypothetical protein
MKTKILGTTLLLMTLSFSMWAQGPGSRGRRVPASYDRGSCTQYIEGLTDKQIQKITTLEATHREQMEQLRNNRRSTIDFEAKDNIRDEMIKLRDKQRDEVRKLLTKEQQKAYDALPRDRYQEVRPEYYGRGRRGDYDRRGAYGRSESYRRGGRRR